MKPPRDRPSASTACVFFADSAVRPNHGAVDHVGSAFPAGHLGESFEKVVEHTRLDPVSILPDDAVPLAILEPITKSLVERAKCNRKACNHIQNGAKFLTRPPRGC